MMADTWLSSLLISRDILTQVIQLEVVLSTDKKLRESVTLKKNWHRITKNFVRTLLISMNTWKCESTLIVVLLLNLHSRIYLNMCEGVTGETCAYVMIVFKLFPFMGQIKGKQVKYSKRWLREWQFHMISETWGKEWQMMILWNEN